MALLIILLWTSRRLHLDVHGFVVVPSIFSDGEIARMLGAMQRLRDDLKAAQRAALPGGGWAAGAPRGAAMAPALPAVPPAKTSRGAARGPRTSAVQMAFVPVIFSKKAIASYKLF